MTQVEPPSTRLKLSLTEVPARDRAAVFREVVGARMARWDLTPRDDGPIIADLEWASIPAAEIVWGAIGPTDIRRGPREIADAADGFGFSFARSGCWRMETGDRALAETEGRSGLLSLTEPSRVSVLADSRFTVLQLPRRALADRVANPDDALLRPVPFDSGPLWLLERYVDLVREMQALSEAAGAAIAEHLADLLGLVIGPTADGRARAIADGLPKATLTAAKADIEARLHWPGLDIGSVAARLGVSPRQAQRLFEREGETFSGYVLRRRLAVARQRLADPAHRGSSIAEVVFDCGFGDLSHFNRAFRLAFGMTPRDVRAQASASDHDEQPAALAPTPTDAAP